jgi:hypothetical protein
MKILYTRKSIKQHIYYFSYVRHSKQAYHKKLLHACVIQLLLSIKNNKNHQLKALELHIKIFP